MIPSTLPYYIPIIGVCGKARSGKDEMSQVLRELTGYDTYALADPLKRCVNEIFGWDERHSFGPLKEKMTTVYMFRKLHIVNTIRKHIGCRIQSSYFRDDDILFKYFLRIVCNDDRWYTAISPRIAYQRFGTDFARELFCDSMWFDIAPKSDIIISDIRFENEARWIRKANGLLIHITRENMPDTMVAKHKSENGIVFVEGDVKILNVDAPDWKEKLVKNTESVILDVHQTRADNASW